MVRILYIAGGVSLPTSGQANPTLTIVALSLRLAEHLKANLGRYASAHVRASASDSPGSSSSVMADLAAGLVCGSASSR